MGEVETIFTLAELIQALSQSVKNGEMLPQEMIDFLDTLNNGEMGDNDIENLLVEIKNSLVTANDTETITISHRLDVIDARLDREFLSLNNCLSMIMTCAFSFFVFKIITWFYNILSR